MSTFTERLFDERDTADPHQIVFFMGVPYHTDLVGTRIYHIKDQTGSVIHPEIPGLSGILGRASRTPDPARDLQDMKMLYKDRKLYDACVCYWLTVHETGVVYNGKDIEFLRACDTVRKGIKQENLLCKEDALLVVHAAYFGNMTRILRVLSGISSLARVLNVIEALTTVVNTEIIGGDTQTLRNMLIHDVLVNRIDLKEEIKGLKHPWSNHAQFKKLEKEAFDQRRVRMDMITKGQDPIKRPQGDNYWTFRKRGNKMDFYGLRTGRKTIEFTCFFSVQGRTLSFDETEEGFSSLSLEDLLRSKGPIFDFEKYLYE